MVHYNNSGSNGCQGCTATCSGGCGGSYDNRSYYLHENTYDHFLKTMDHPSPKEIFWSFIRSLFPIKIQVMEKMKDLRLSSKRYFRKMMFCRSGYLPNRIRQIRCST